MGIQKLGGAAKTHHILNYTYILEASQRSSTWTKTKKNVVEFLPLESLPFLYHWLALLLVPSTLILTNPKLRKKTSFPLVQLSRKFLFTCSSLASLISLLSF